MIWMQLMILYLDLPAGGTSIGDGDLIAAGVSQLEFLDSYYNDLANSQAPKEKDNGR